MTDMDELFNSAFDFGLGTGNANMPAGSVLWGNTLVPMTDMATFLQKELDKQILEFSNNKAAAGIEINDRAAFQKLYEPLEEQMVQFTKKRIAASMAVDLLKDLIEETVQSIGIDISSISPVSKKTGLQKTDSFLRTERAGLYGDFIQETFLGVPKDSYPGQDLKEYEIKATTKEDYDMHGLHVGNITVFDVAKGRRGDLADKLIILYKLAQKMQAFLLIRITELPLMTAGIGRIHIESIQLFLKLILKALFIHVYESIMKTEGSYYGGKEEGALFKITRGHWEPGEGGMTGRRTYSISLSLKRINDVYEFEKLYLLRRDLLRDIKGNSSARVEFFTSILNLQRINL